MKPHLLQILFEQSVGIMFEIVWFVAKTHSMHQLFEDLKN